MHVAVDNINASPQASLNGATMTLMVDGNPIKAIIHQQNVIRDRDAATGVALA